MNIRNKSNYERKQINKMKQKKTVTISNILEVVTEEYIHRNEGYTDFQQEGGNKLIKRIIRDSINCVQWDKVNIINSRNVENTCQYMFRRNKK